MTEKPAIGSKEDYINRLNSCLESLALPSYGSKPFDELLDDQLRVLNLEGIHSREEAFVGVVLEQAKGSGLGGRMVVHLAAMGWDHIHGSQTLSLAQALAPLES